MTCGGFHLWSPYHLLQLLVVYILTLLDERRDRFTENRDIVSDRFKDNMLEDITNDFDYIRNSSCRDLEFGLKEIQPTSVGRGPVAQGTSPRRRDMERLCQPSIPPPTAVKIRQVVGIHAFHSRQRFLQSKIWIVIAIVSDISHSRLLRPAAYISSTRSSE